MIEHLFTELWYPCLTHTLLKTALAVEKKEKVPLGIKRFTSYSSWSFELLWVVFSGGTKQILRG